MSGRHTGVTLVLSDMALGEVALHIVFDNITTQTWKDHHCYVDIITVINTLLFGLPKYQLDHLQKVQNATAWFSDC